MENTITTILNANVTVANKLKPILMLHDCEEYVQKARSLTFKSNKDNAIATLCLLSEVAGVKINVQHKINYGDRMVNLLITFANGEIMPDKVEIMYLVRWHGRDLDVEEKSAVLKEMLPHLSFLDKAKALDGMQSIELDIRDMYVETPMFPNVISIKKGSKIDIFVN